MGNKHHEDNAELKMSSKEVMYLVALLGFLILTLGVISKTMAG